MSETTSAATASTATIAAPQSVAISARGWRDCTIGTPPTAGVRRPMRTPAATRQAAAIEDRGQPDRYPEHEQRAQDDALDGPADQECETDQPQVSQPPRQPERIEEREADTEEDELVRDQLEVGDGQCSTRTTFVPGAPRLVSSAYGIPSFSEDSW